MATKIKVTGSKGHGNFMHLEINGGSSGKMGDGHHEFTIGQKGAIVQYLTIQRHAQGNIKVTAETNDIYIEINNGKPKHIKKGSSITLPANAKRTTVRERPHR